MSWSFGVHTFLFMLTSSFSFVFHGKKSGSFGTIEVTASQTLFSAAPSLKGWTGDKRNWGNKKNKISRESGSKPNEKVGIDMKEVHLRDSRS